MKRLFTAMALAMVGLSPATGAACEDSDASSASGTPPALLGAAPAPAPAASTVPAPKVARALVPKPAKLAVAKAKGPVPDQKVASVSADRN